MANNELEFEFNGKLITYTEYKIIVRKFIEKQVSTLEELQELWIDDSKRRKFIDMLHEMQIDINIIKEAEKTEKSDTFDVIANMVFEAPLITRKERLQKYIDEHIDEISHKDEQIKNIIISVLDKYEKGGIENINIRILLSEDMIQKDAYNILKTKLGSINVAKLFKDIKNELYSV
ncbi:MAG TPA: type I restriction-modification enzyme R subunit C-terminal domain-containing protein [Methanobacterium sp.]|nr:type I restriction-modification enzyme R subunit C-terminal domain-containing protein [Methanobacterium sp.]